MYECRTQNYDPKIHEEYHIHDTPILRLRPIKVRDSVIDQYRTGELSMFEQH